MEYGNLSNRGDGNHSPSLREISRLGYLHQACKRVNYILHQAALGSVPCSQEDLNTANQLNIDRFLNMLAAVNEVKVGLDKTMK